MTEFSDRTPITTLKPTVDPLFYGFSALLAEARNNFDLQGSQMRALETMMINTSVQASILWRDQLQHVGGVPGRAHSTHDFRRANLIAAAQGKELASERPKQVTLTTTSHPNGNLHIPMEASMLKFIEMLNNLSLEQKQRFIAFGEHKEVDIEQLDFVQPLIQQLKLVLENFEVPPKQSMDDAMERGLMFNREIVRRIPAYFDSALRATAVFKEETKGFVSAEALRKIGRPIKLLTWYDADGDGNPFVVPEVTAKGIKRSEEVARQLYIDLLESVRRDKNLGNDATAQAIKEDIAELQRWLKESPSPMDIYSQENGLLENLYALKERIENDQGVHLSKVKVDGHESIMTTLDAAISTVQNTGAVIAEKELRQNAETIRAAMDVMAERLLAKGIFNEKDVSSNIKMLRAVSHDAKKAAAVRAFINEDMEEMASRPVVLEGKEADYYKILSFMKLANENAYAVNSIVIAETGAMRKEDLEGESQAVQQQSLSAEKGLKDLVSTEFFLEMTAPKDAQKRIEPRGLFEGRLPVENISFMLASLLKESPELRKRYEEIITVMYAQSDTSREHGILSIITVFDSIDQNKKLAADLGRDMVKKFYPELKGVAAKEKAEEFEILIKLGAGASLSRGFPPSLLHSNDTTLQGGSLVYLASLVDRFAEWMTGTKASHKMGHRLTPEEAERISRFSYTGDILLMSENLSPKVKKYIRELGLEGCEPYEQFMDDPRVQEWFDHSPYGSIVGPNNKGPRPNQKKKEGAAEVFPPNNPIHKARAIGSGLAQYTEGTDHIFTIGLPEFFKLDEEGNISEDTVKKVVGVLKESAMHNEMISRAELGILLSDFDTAWKAHGYKRHRNENNEVVISRVDEEGKTHTVSLRELSAAYKAPYDKNPPDFSNHMECKGFGADAIALGYQDITNEHAARAIYEVRFQQQKDYAVKRAGGIKRGEGVIGYVTPDQFTPEHLYKVVPLVIQHQLKLLKPRLDEARNELADENARWLKEGAGWTAEQKKAFADKNYYNYITIEQSVECGMALSGVLTQQQAIHDNWKTKDRGASALAV